MKFCKYCNEKHELTSEFWYRLSGSPQCKEDRKAAGKRRYIKTREDRLAYRREYVKKNREAVLQSYRGWRQKNPGKVAEYRSKMDKTILAARAKKYRLENKEKIRDKKKIYVSNKRKTNISYNLRIILRQRLNKAVKHGYKAGSAVSDLGCSVEEFKIWIESKFQPGMSWDNYGRHGWHIDHILPLSWFDLSDWKQFQIAVNYTNMQPLWALDNIKKADKAR